jgi:hypothetical protein
VIPEPWEKGRPSGLISRSCEGKPLIRAPDTSDSVVLRHVHSDALLLEPVQRGLEEVTRCGLWCDIRLDEDGAPRRGYQTHPWREVSRRGELVGGMGWREGDYRQHVRLR